MMNRKLNTKKNGESWIIEIIKSVFKKGIEVSSQQKSSVIRKDICNAIILFNEYGNRDSRFGWEVDHINPVANNGSDELDNLQPLQWKNNLEKGNQLNWKCY